MMVLKLKKDRNGVNLKNTMFYSKKSIRMCVVCKKRDFQKDLLRFKSLESTLQLYEGSGRSFYVCYECLQKDGIQKSMKRFVSKADNLREQIEEIIRKCQK